MAYNKNNGTTGSQAALGSQNQCAVRGPPVVQHAFSTPQPLLRASNLNAGVPQMLHRPLPFPQPLWEPLLSGIEWFTGLSESDTATLLNSLKSSLSLHFCPSARLPLEISLEMDGSGAPGPHEIPGMKEGNDEPWTQSPDDGPTNIDEPPLVSTLQEPGRPKKRKQKSCSITIATGCHHATVPRAALAIPVSDLAVSGAAGKHHTVVAQTDEFTELVLSIFTEAAFDLEMGNPRPTAEDMKLIQSRVPTFRGGLKVVAPIETLKNPMLELISTMLEKNRAPIVIRTAVSVSKGNVI
ncbi:hypothetical protein B0H14DRAFT_2615147 [Mycena olivaceomarginata]|nr:hypothetical protein B0H14DRAFT_2615147 [Mycena olivaceomarginata]